VKPFDLEKAKAGAPWVTGDGEKHKFIAFTSEAKDSNHVVTLCPQDSTLYVWTVEGTNPFRDERLFLADPPKVKKSRAVGVVRLGSHGDLSSQSEPTIGELNQWAVKHGFEILAATELTWEEEAP